MLKYLKSINFITFTYLTFISCKSKESPYYMLNSQTAR